MIRSRWAREAIDCDYGRLFISAQKLHSILTHRVVRLLKAVRGMGWPKVALIQVYFDDSKGLR